MFIILKSYTLIEIVLSPPYQVENIENPLGSFGRVEADNGVHMRIVLQGQDNRQGRGSNVGEKSFRCEYEGCGKLYTTAHHLKVSVGVVCTRIYVLMK